MNQAFGHGTVNERTVQRSYERCKECFGWLSNMGSDELNEMIEANE